MITLAGRPDRTSGRADVFLRAMWVYWRKNVLMPILAVQVARAAKGTKEKSVPWSNPPSAGDISIAVL
jgi:hypothetical protein